MGTFNPSDGLMRNALEASEGILVDSGYHDHDFVSESLTSLQEVIEQRSITRNAQRPLSAESKIAVGGTFDTDLNAEGHIHYLANAQRKFTTDIFSAGVAFKHKLAPSAGTAFPTTMQVEVWRADDLPAGHPRQHGQSGTWASASVSSSSASSGSSARWRTTGRWAPRRAERVVPSRRSVAS